MSPKSYASKAAGVSHQAQTLRPESDRLDDSLLIARARDHLGLLEFDLFRAAWKHWHGDAPNERRLERDFVSYMFHQSAPVYVRDFARRVIAKAESGGFNPRAFGGTGGPPPDALPSLGDPYSLAGFGFLLIAVLLFAL